MTFVKPSTITSQTGAYSYKRGLSSPTMDYIDNSFPYIVDARGSSITGSLTFLSGSSLTMAGGSNFYLQEFANFTADYGSTTTFNSGSTIEVAGLMAFGSSAIMRIYGDNIQIEDNTFPQFINTQTRYIAQPLLAIGVFNGATNGYYVLDVVGGTNLFLPFTKLPLGATLTQVDINYNVASGHTPAGPAVAVLVKIKPNIGTPIPVGTTINPVVVSVGGQVQMSFTGLSELIDDTYEYGVSLESESSTGAQAIKWFGCGTHFTYTQLAPF